MEILPLEKWKKVQAKAYRTVAGQIDHGGTPSMISFYAASIGRSKQYEAAIGETKLYKGKHHQC